MVCTCLWIVKFVRNVTSHQHVHTMSVHGIDMYITHYVHTMSVRVYDIFVIFRFQVGIYIMMSTHVQPVAKAR